MQVRSPGVCRNPTRRDATLDALQGLLIECQLPRILLEGCFLLSRSAIRLADYNLTLHRFKSGRLTRFGYALRALVLRKPACAMIYLGYRALHATLVR